MKRHLKPHLKESIYYIKKYCQGVLVCILLIIYGCGGSDTNDVMTLDEEKMIDVLFDLRIIDNQIKKHHVLDRDSVSKVFIELLYDIHDITSEELIYNLQIVQRSPEMARKFEDIVLKKMVQKKKDFESLDIIE